MAKWKNFDPSDYLRAAMLMVISASALLILIFTVAALVEWVGPLPLVGAGLLALGWIVYRACLDVVRGE